MTIDLITLSAAKKYITDSMNDLGVQETVLWEGSIGSNLTNYFVSTKLSNSLLNYDKIRFHIRYNGGTTDDSDVFYNREITPYDFNQMKNSKATKSSIISFVWGYGGNNDSANIIQTSTDTMLQWNISRSFVTKIVGIKYKTF